MSYKTRYPYSTVPKGAAALAHPVPCTDCKRGSHVIRLKDKAPFCMHCFRREAGA